MITGTILLALGYLVWVRYRYSLGTVVARKRLPPPDPLESVLNLIAAQPGPKYWGVASTLRREADRGLLTRKELYERVRPVLEELQGDYEDLRTQEAELLSNLLKRKGF
mgnify:CR=1 FL=1